MVGEKIKALRKARNLTQEELGEIIEKSQPTVCRIENGLVKIRWDDIKEFAKKLNVSEDYLTKETDKKPNASDIF